ncbi:TetR/AcrR family transcriptional regulator [Mycolicibacterium brumae]|uniref:TetR/AcrR family transcriptional regulator n=1 Tax=Mycolicibacterium brumae TaxID=85968 RepID=A0A2G5P868_9MYCO|nr:TetR/AcrR family transcriptional regulator [Mycolicibacterium brumae]MCV7194793.1 TetR/AcrR family transcriptional regulator [Mycolicibacterium brumae]PIB74548.1 TetR/AcrR family transcriptional regulator [Mycolicibacterium brumae]RWA19787.1 hypothetical protein MBRU_16500 [Mycolicibacterium brumae DSM 44177]UWW09564.1 TetR/AcrR family transcriptional regulator [Mycolicibacterium brumae]
MAPERADAARNRARVLDAARRLVSAHGPGQVSMDQVAAAAGVGKGTLFRRFGSRADLMAALLDDEERLSQRAFLFGDPPLGPGAPPLERLRAFGEHRIRYAHRHHALLIAAGRAAPHHRQSPPETVIRAHVRILLAAAGSSGDLDAQADALTALLNPEYVEALCHEGRDEDHQIRAWASLAAKLCGH